MNCTRCEKPLSFNEVGLNKKFNAAGRLCMCCLSEKLGVSAERLRQKIAEYLAAGCRYFVKE